MLPLTPPNCPRTVEIIMCLTLNCALLWRGSMRQLVACALKTGNKVSAVPMIAAVLRGCLTGWLDTLAGQNKYAPRTAAGLNFPGDGVGGHIHDRDIVRGAIGRIERLAIR